MLLSHNVFCAHIGSSANEVNLSHHNGFFGPNAFMLCSNRFRAAVFCNSNPTNEAAGTANRDLRKWARTTAHLRAAAVKREPSPPLPLL
jgi:hypothetical protein